jgi:formylglycine-generating enzyme required for sulfatase activity
MLTRIGSVALGLLVLGGCASRAPELPPPVDLARPGALFQDCAECPLMVTLPIGEVTIGSPPGVPEALGLDAERSARERPQRSIAVATRIAMAQTEVTVAQFAAFVAATGRQMTPGCWHFVGTEWRFDASRSWMEPGGEISDSHPVLCVNKDDAQAYAIWLSGKTGSATACRAKRSGSSRPAAARKRHGIGATTSGNSARSPMRATKRRRARSAGKANASNMPVCRTGAPFPAMTVTLPSRR